MKNNGRTRSRTGRKNHRTPCNNTDTTESASSSTAEHTSKPSSQRMPNSINFIRIDTIIFRNFLYKCIKKLIISQCAWSISWISPISSRSFLWQGSRIDNDNIFFSGFFKSIISKSIITSCTSMKSQNQLCRSR